MSSIHWDAPAGWTAQPASGLRLASFRAPGPGGTTADISIFTFAGAGGDPLANINRWRAQLHLPAIPAEKLPSEITPLDTPAGQCLVADIRGEAAGGKPALRIFGAWLKQSERIWFFKMMGPAETVDAQKDPFLGLLRSLTPGPAPVQMGGAANTNDLPSFHLAVAPTGTADEPSLAWDAPADWHPKAASAMRKGSYTITRGGVDVDLAITAFPGDVGGLVANVNRWRNQVGLGPVDDSAAGAVTESVDTNGLHIIIVDVAGQMPAGEQRILAGLVSWQGATWFFKMAGPGPVVEAEKPAFLAFLKTVRAK
jgi:hypothetical protein